MDTTLFEERVREIPRLRSCLSGGRVERWPRKQALRDMLFDIIVGCMQEGPTWTEREITRELAAITADPAILRRALINEERLVRSPDGSQYRLASKVTSGQSFPERARLNQGIRARPAGCEQARGLAPIQDHF